MSNRKKSRFSRTSRAKTKLRIRENLIKNTKIEKIIENMMLKDFANYR